MIRALRDKIESMQKQMGNVENVENVEKWKP